MAAGKRRLEQQKARAARKAAAMKPGGDSGYARRYKRRPVLRRGVHESGMPYEVRTPRPMLDRSGA